MFILFRLFIQYLFFFFFQAEDGIRDLYVTGVQTCALPISCRRRRPLGQSRFGYSVGRLALELPRGYRAWFSARHPRTDVLARGGVAEFARARQAPAHDALAVARVPRRRSLPRLRHARRRPAGSVVAQLLPAARRSRAGPAGRDRRAELRHEPLSELVLSARE